VLQLSIKAKDDAEMREVLEDYQSQSSTGATTQLGALLRAQLDGNKSE
jgi:small subunit ribosomal protein S1